MYVFSSATRQPESRPLNRAVNLGRHANSEQQHFRKQRAAVFIMALQAECGCHLQELAADIDSLFQLIRHLRRVWDLE